MTGVLQPLTSEQLDPTVTGKLGPIIERVGYFGEFFAYAGHAPAVLAAFLDYTTTLKPHLPDRLNEVIALTVCARYRSPYERVQHERLSLRLGFPKAWIAELVSGREAQISALAEDERALRTLANAVLDRNGEDVEAELQNVARFLDPSQLVAALHQIVRLQGICIISNVFGLEAPAPSPIENPA